jgi:hypothetical protein
MYQIVCYLSTATLSITVFSTGTVIVRIEPPEAAFIGSGLKTAPNLFIAK